MEKEPGWYPDPDDPESLRHWDGSGWSESLFDDIASVAVVESRDAGHLLDAGHQQARVALPENAVAGGSVAVGSTTVPSGPPTKDTSDWVESPHLPPADDEEPNSVSRWDPPKRSRTARVVIVAAAILAAAMVGVLLWQLLGDDSGDDSSSESVVADDPAPTEEAVTATATAEPTPAPTSEPVEASPSSAGSDSEEPTPTPEPPAEDPVPAEPEPAEANVLIDIARLRAEPTLESPEVGVIDSLETPQVMIVGAPVDGWRQVIFSGWIWGAFVAPAAEDQIVARTIDGSNAVLRDAEGAPTGAPAFGGSYVLVVDGSTDLWKVILPEGGFGYVESAEFDLVLF